MGYSLAMTLKTRNRLYFVFFLIASLVFLFYMVFLAYAFFSHGITPPENYIRTLKLASKISFLPYSFSAVLFSLIAFSLYVPITSFVIYESFEKTQCLEVIYFAAFLIGCLLECMRFFVPLFELWKSYSAFLMFIGNSVITGRLLCVLSLLFASLFSETEQRQNAERNFVILLSASVICGFLVPLNTTQTTSTCMVLWGYRNVFFVIRLSLFLAAVSVLIVNAIRKSSKDLRYTSVGVTLLYIGYSFLCSADNYVYFILGSVLLIAGTFMYLHSIHRLYMWH